MRILAWVLNDRPTGAKAQSNFAGFHAALEGPLFHGTEAFIVGQAVVGP